LIAPAVQLEAFHFALTEASDAFEISMTDCPCDEITEYVPKIAFVT
jgi:hypothetical protein